MNDKFVLNDASNEQLKILKYLKKSYNVVVDSVPGSGKTTSCLHIAKQLSEKNILLLTYNARLKEETRQKKNYFKLDNLEVHSYHAYCMKYYSNCLVDEDIKNIIENNIKPRKKIKYDIIIIDESQDITYLFYNLVCKIVKDMDLKNFQFCIIGDKYQSIYQYNGADQRFITGAERIFNFNKYDWKILNLSVSFRLTNKMGEFLNTCVLDSNRINTVKIKNNNVRYMFTDPFNDQKTYDEIIYYLDIGYKVEDIFVLAPSIKSKSDKSPIRILSNKLSEKGYFIYLPKSDEEKVSNKPEELKGKIMFLSYHQSKGLEKKVVIVIGFDNTWFDYFGKYKLFGKNNVSNDIIENYMSKCPNELYVAITRAQECMTLVHQKSKKYLKFLKDDLLDIYSEIDGNNTVVNGGGLVYKYKSVTEIIRHLSDEILCNALEYIEETVIESDNNELIEVESLIKQKDGNLENISDITGTSIPIYFEYSHTHKLTFIYDINVNNNIFNCDMEKINYIIDPIKSSLENNITIQTSDILKISNVVNYYKDGFLFKLNQINNYNYIDKKIFKKTNDRISEHIDKTKKFQTEFLITTDNFKNPPELLGISIGGAIDFVNENNVYEFKHVIKLDNSHKIQLAIYMYLYEMYKFITFNESKTRYYLLNIHNNTKFRFRSNLENLKKMMEYILFSKYYKNNEIDDKTFNKKCDDIRKKYKI